MGEAAQRNRILNDIIRGEMQAQAVFLPVDYGVRRPSCSCSSLLELALPFFLPVVGMLLNLY